MNDPFEDQDGSYVALMNDEGQYSARRRWRRSQINVRSSSSRPQVCTHRFMTEFILGIRTPLSTTSMPASSSTSSNNCGNFPSRSLIMQRARQPASTWSTTASHLDGRRRRR
ncbi:hypothetical protein SAVERM_873 [Streptomyces avermitilis MA-4680 = NBRC 14893]|uniref:MbtH-like domain-containing protein n=1 Tax=Streptomyces avermitilis (strain ATCC 31267 / DSM 46492 / JCM 5070 / NBRC 14893 / NCIMB 12804 / NRRL 8165 / MA-4680) TaxID=227882 RepID=Q82PM9_STRAW|nr:MbtH family NRPS accessory protein [Streptomyces sp. SID5469]BAC68583.1 hypothetical protein SAVERM_873 [Streptomyces avermitilis MA-4680 = NBRC 14893]